MSKRTTIYLDDETYRNLQYLSHQDNRTVSNIITVLVRNAMQAQNSTLPASLAQQPAAAVPSAPAAPPAWVCPSPEEIRRLEPYQALTLIMEHWDEMDYECQQAAADAQEVTYEQAEELAHGDD